MKLKMYVLALMVFMTGALFAEKSSGSEEPKIRVLITENTPSVLLEARGGHSVINTKTGYNMSIGGFFGKLYPACAGGEGIRWGEIYPGVFQITIVPDEGVSMLVNGVEYKGSITLHQTHDVLAVVNEVSLDEYVRSTLSAQFDKALEPEAMAAIAIAARTEAAYIGDRNRTADWMVKADDVGYQGYGITHRQNGVDVAVEATKGLILQRNSASALGFAARWTGDCAGKTAPYHVIYRKEAYAPKMGVEAPFAAMHRTESKWQLQATKEDLGRALNMGKISKVEPYVDAESSKVYAVQFVDDSGHTKSLDFQQLQRLLGKNNLKSSDFKVEIVGGNVNFEGYGIGTGVGLCLYSAEAMANKGKTAPEILSQFFPDTRLINLQSADSTR